MGRNKLLLDIGGATLLSRVHDALVSRCAEVFIVGATRSVPVGARRIPDLRAGRQGPLAGIEAGLLAARHRPVFVAAGDMPFVTGDFVEHLLDLLSHDVSAVVPYFGGGIHPLCAAYGREIKPRVSAALDRGVRSVRGLLEELPRVRYIGEEELWRCGDPNLLLTNVNSPEDLSRTRAVLREGALRSG